MFQYQAIHRARLRIFWEIVVSAPHLTKLTLSGVITGPVLQQMGIVSELENLTLHGDSFLPLRGPWSCIHPSHLCTLFMSGSSEFVMLMIHTVISSAITHLHIKSYAEDNTSGLMADVMLYRNLTDLRLNLQASGDGWSAASILYELKGIPNLVAFRFFITGYLCLNDPADLTDTEAKYICKTWPNLSVVEVALATHAFFLSILDLTHLEQLQLNAWLWPAGLTDTCKTSHKALSSLRFTGSPSCWAQHGPIEIDLAQFPRLHHPEIVRGHGGYVKNIPRWACSDPESSEFTDDE